VDSFLELEPLLPPKLVSAERELSWKLLDESKQVILSAGPFGECNVNTQAICLHVIMQDKAGCCSYGNEVFTKRRRKIKGKKEKRRNRTIINL
jgi:hypothetical protein